MMGKKKKSDEQSTEELLAEADAMMAQLDDMIGMQLEKIDTIIKKATVYTVVWALVTAAVYYYWPSTWYYWAPAFLAIITLASLIFAVVMKKKLSKKINE